MTDSIKTFQITENNEGYLEVQSSSSLNDLSNWLSLKEIPWQLIHMGTKPLAMEEAMNFKKRHSSGYYVCPAVWGLLGSTPLGQDSPRFSQANYSKCNEFNFFGFVRSGSDFGWGKAEPKKASAKPKKERSVRRNSMFDFIWVRNELKEYLVRYPEDEEELKKIGINTSDDVWATYWGKEAQELYSRLRSFMKEHAQSKFSLFLQETRRTVLAECVLAYLDFMPEFELNHIFPCSTRLENAFHSEQISTLLDLKGNRDFFYKKKSLGAGCFLEILSWLLKMDIGSNIEPANKPLKVEVVVKEDKTITRLAKIKKALLVPEKVDLIQTPPEAGIGLVYFNFFENYSRLYPKTKRACEICQYRLAGISLQEIGDVYGITRERVRQLEDKMLQSCERAIRGALYNEGLVSDLLYFSKRLSDSLSIQSGSLEDALMAISFLKEDEYVKVKQQTLRYMSSMIGSGVEFSIIESGGVAYFGPCSKAINVEKARKEAMKHYIRPKSKTLEVFDMDSAVRSVTSFFQKMGACWSTARIMADNFIGEFSVITPDGDLLFETRNKSRASVYLDLAVLSAKKGIIDLNLDSDEIVKARLGRSITINHINSLVHYERDALSTESGKFLFCLGHSKFSVWSGLGVAEENAKTIVRECYLLMSKNPEKEFSDKELFMHVKKKGLVTWALPVKTSDKHVISACLMRFPHEDIRYLGRYIWKKGSPVKEKPSKDRTHISVLVKEFMNKMGRPVTSAEAHEYISSVRGVGGIFQIVAKGSVVPIRTNHGSMLFWDTDLGEIPQIPN